MNKNARRIKSDEMNTYHLDKYGFKRVTDLPGEEWRLCLQSLRYSVSNKGRFKRNMCVLAYANGSERLLPERLIAINTDKRGYQYVKIFDFTNKVKRIAFHRIVCLAFNGEPPEGMTDVNHKDENKSNNVPENLEWSSRKSNLNYGNHNSNVSNTHKNIKMSDACREAARQANSKKVKTIDGVFESAKSAAEHYGINHRCLCAYLNGNKQMPEKYKYLQAHYA